MGVTIHNTLMTGKGRVKHTLDHAEKVAQTFKKQADSLGLPFDIDRKSDTCLHINIKGCETLAFDFKRLNEQWKIDEKKYFDSYTEEQRSKWLPFDKSPETSDHYKLWPDQVSLWSTEFTKTQYGEGIITHVWVAEIMRAVASMCELADVHDEGDYYHTRNTKDAFEAIGQNQALIDGMMGTFKSLGYDVKKGEDL